MKWKVSAWHWDKEKEIGWWQSLGETEDPEKTILAFQKENICAKATSAIGEIGCTKTSFWKLTWRS